MSLSHKDVQDILRQLEDTSYDELLLETENYTLKLKRGEGGWTQETRTEAGDRRQEAGIASIATVEKQSEPEPAEAGLIDIRAPIVGTFYRAPKPGADPFVEIGSTLKSDSVIAIIEVMKLMNSIPAGVAGEVVEILAEDAQFIEKGQLLMRVRPA
jgi:acetyl-CoA carboxylase biotin carboxyl carrier protein